MYIYIIILASWQGRKWTSWFRNPVAVVSGRSALGSMCRRLHTAASVPSCSNGSCIEWNHRDNLWQKEKKITIWEWQTIEVAAPDIVIKVPIICIFNEMQPLHDMPCLKSWGRDGLHRVWKRLYIYIYIYIYIIGSGSGMVWCAPG